VNLPFVMQNDEESKIFHETLRPYLDDIYEENWNQQILFQVYWPFSGFWTKHPLESVDDMEGLKMRTPNKMAALVAEELDSNAVTMPFDEVYSGLSTDIIDAVTTSTPSGVDGKFWEVLDYYSPTNVNGGHDVVSINQDEFNKLDKEL